MGGSRGVNDWYLDREARGGWSHVDDEQPARGPDDWLDQLTGPAAQRGLRSKRTLAPKSARQARIGSGSTASTHSSDSSNRRTPSPANGRARLSAAAKEGARSAAESPRKKAQTRTTAMQVNPAIARAEDRALAQTVIQMQESARQSLSYAEVVRRLREWGQVVTKSDLKRALQAEKAAWGKPSKKAKSGFGAIPAPTAVQRAPTGVVKKLRPGVLGPVHRLRQARPAVSIDEVTRVLRAQGLRVTDVEVRMAFRKDQLGGRPGGRPTQAERELARQACLLNARSERELSFAELVSRLGQAGWQTTIPDLDYALFVTRTRLVEHRTQPGATRMPPRGISQQSLELTDDLLDLTMCRACGMHVASSGYCRCS